MKRRSARRYIMIISWIVVVTSGILATSSSAGSWTPEEELKTFMTENYPWEEIEVSNVTPIYTLPEDRPVRVQLEKGPLGRAVFSFIFANTEKILVRADVTAYGRVVMSRRPFQRRHVIEEDDIYISKMDIEKMPANVIKYPEKILGKSLKRSINENMPIEEDMVEMSQFVKRGKRVVLLLSHEGMTIRAAGKTKEKGYIGMSVRAINTSSKKVVSGILIDENTIKVEL